MRWIRAALGMAMVAGLAATSPVAAMSEPTRLQPTRYELDLRVDFEEERIDGRASVSLRNAGEASVTEASFLLYRLMTVKAIQDAGGLAIPFRQSVVAFEDSPRRQANHVVVSLVRPLAPGESTVVAIDYGGYLAGYVETGSLYIKDRVDETFTIIREDADAYPTVGVPSFRANRAAGLPEFDYLARVTVPVTHVVANGGVLVDKTVRDTRVTYTYRNARPAWRMDFAIARYRTHEIPGFRMFVLPEDAAGAERVLKAAADSMSLYSEWFGPRKGTETFTLIEIPDGWGSQTDVTSVIQAAAAFKDPGRLYEVYHEISHLWDVKSLDRPYCRWNEGLASFLEDLTRERLEGGPPLDAAARRIADRLVRRAADQPRLRSVPMIDYGREGVTDYAYGTGMLMFYVLHSLVGQQAFNAVIGGFYRKYQETGASTSQFVEYAQSAVEQDLQPLFQDWLYSTRWHEILSSGTKIEGFAERYRSSAHEP